MSREKLIIREWSEPYVVVKCTECGEYAGEPIGHGPVSWMLWPNRDAVVQRMKETHEPCAEARRQRAGVQEMML